MRAKGFTNFSAPVRSVYVDYRDINWNDASVTVKAIADRGYNVILLAFWMASWPADMVLVWTQLSSSAQIATRDYVHSKGGILLLSAGGSTESPYAMSATTYCTNAANFALQHHFDGVDFDMENFGAGLTYGSISGVQWLTECTLAARAVLGPNGIIAHAPQAPYFGRVGSAVPNSWTGTSGGYTAVELNTADAVDFYLAQFYNQGPTCYTTYRGLFVESANDCSVFPGTSVSEIASYGVPLSKLVVGKPTLVFDANNGWVNPATLGQYMQQAGAELGFGSGVMTWAWSASASEGYVNDIYPPASIVGEPAEAGQNVLPGSSESADSSDSIDIKTLAVVLPVMAVGVAAVAALAIAIVRIKRRQRGNAKVEPMRQP